MSETEGQRDLDVGEQGGNSGSMGAKSKTGGIPKNPKKGRTSAKRMFTLAIKALEEAISNEQSQSVVESLFLNISQCLSKVQSEHALYLMNILGDDDEDVPDEEVSWLLECSARYASIGTAKDKYLNKTDDAPKVKEEVMLKKRTVKFEKSSLTSCIENLKEISADVSVSTRVIKEEQQRMKSQLNRYLTAQRELVLELSDEEEAEGELALCTKMERLCLQANVLAGKRTEEEEQTKKDVSAKNQKGQVGGLEIKFNRMNLPTFDGDIREYARFKSHYNKVVKPHVKNEDDEIYVLKTECLKKEAEEHVRNVDDSLKEIWKRLEDRFGRPELASRAFLSDLRQITQVAEGDNTKFIKLVDMVERCYKGLERIGMESEISNSTIIGTIEDRLPPSLKMRWSIEVCSDDSQLTANQQEEPKSRFQQLLDFLLRHRRAMEYSNVDLKIKKTPKMPEASVHHVQKTDDESSENERQTRVPGCWYHSTNSHTIHECTVYANASVNERWDMVRDQRVCWLCLKRGHRQADCYSNKECGVDGCKSKHHKTLHRQNNDQSGKSKEADVKPPEKLEGVPVSHASNAGGKVKVCLLQLMEVRAGDDGQSKLNAFWDGGSKVSMITFAKAKQLGLKGESIKISIIKVGGDKETIDSQLYRVPIVDRDGNREYFTAFGIKRISTKIESNDVSAVARLLNVEDEEVKRPDGEIEMLIGFEYAGFHPEKVKAIDHLLLLENKFGRCIGGTHELLQEKTQLFVQDVQVSHVNVKLEEFFDAETMGVSCVPKCGNCKCGHCPVGGKQYTLQEERELAMIDKGLDLVDGTWQATYPWQKDPKSLPDNFVAASAMLRSTEKRLMKNDELASKYCEQILDMEKRGVARKLNEADKMYEGPVYYISHHEVLKPESKSTPCRIVFNSSAKFMNSTLNDYWVKGPDLVNNLLGILIRFRENRVGLAGDISKMYHTIKISDTDQHTHRFLWRNMELERQPDIYMMTSVSFGDKPAGAIASLALKKTAELQKDLHPRVASMIMQNSYVDDIVDSFDDAETAKDAAQRADEILANGGFKIKEWTMSADEGTHVKMFEDQGEQSKVLGVGWDTDTDTLSYEVKVNFSQKQRKIRTEPNLTENNVLEGTPIQLTRRMILSQVNGIFDPLGLVSPFVVNAKILLRKITDQKAGWDDPISEKDRNEWTAFFCDMFQIEKIKFARSVKPENAVGNPVLVLFSDASTEAFGACAYVRWETEDGQFMCTLLAAKSKLAPAKRISIPRLELNAALLAARLKKFIVEESRLVFESVYFIVDSEIVRAMIQKESYGFNTFVGVRIGEIQDITDKHDWYWVESSQNIADIISRGAKAAEIGEGSAWQGGPDFLHYPVEHWPVKQSFAGTSLPEAIVMAAPEVEIQPSVTSLINIDRFSSYNMLLRVTARVSSVANNEGRNSLKNISLHPCRKDLTAAELAWIRDSQATLKTDIKAETMKKLGVFEKDGVTVVGSRLESWTHNTYNNSNPILLSAKSKLARLYATKIHNEGHLGVSAVVAKIRSKFWIVGVRNLVKSIRFKCIKCRRFNKSVQQQIMGQVPVERLKPAPAWTYVSIDLFGPLSIKGETNKRSRSKGYGVIFNCLLCRAVHIELATDYGTEAFLLALRRFIALRGKPSKIWSDRGSQIAANIVEEFSSQMGIDWAFSAPDAPWQNGCAESLVKSVKKALHTAIGEQELTFTETQTVLVESAALVNERPIGRHPTDAEDGSYLCPNDLILGRSSNQIPEAEYSLDSSPQKRHQFVQKIVSAFWKKWNRDYFPSLLVRSKWHTAKRNCKVGDIVMIQETGMVRGKWRIGRVIEAEPSLRDGFVRNVKIQYKNPNQVAFTTVVRAVQRIVVLVPVDEE